MYVLISLLCCVSAKIIPLHPIVEVLLLLYYYSNKIIIWKCILGLLFLYPMYLNITLVLLHRYFAHRVFQCNRWVQFLLAWIACIGNQGGPVWWASKHRRHHRTCDTIDDPHSPRHGFWYAWLGWLFFEIHVDKEYVQDLLIYPELQWLDRFYFLPLYAYLCLFPTIEDSIAFGIVPLLSCTIQILYFNVAYHPIPKTVDGNNKICHAMNTHNHFYYPLFYSPNWYDKLNVIPILLGENKHKLHHAKPRQVKRHKYDMGYWCIIYPLLRCKLIKTKQVNR